MLSYNNTTQTTFAAAAFDIVIFIGWIIVLFAPGDWLDLFMSSYG